MPLRALSWILDATDNFWRCPALAVEDARTIIQVLLYLTPTAYDLRGLRQAHRLIEPGAPAPPSSGETCLPPPFIQRRITCQPGISWYRIKTKFVITLALLRALQKYTKFFTSLASLPESYYISEIGPF